MFQNQVASVSSSRHTIYVQVSLTAFSAEGGRGRECCSTVFWELFPHTNELLLEATTDWMRMLHLAQTPADKGTASRVP